MNYLRVAKTKALISFAVTAKLICVFYFANAKVWFSHNEAHILMVAYISSIFIMMTGRLRVYLPQADISNIIICILDRNKSEPIYHNGKQISDDSLILWPINVFSQQQYGHHISFVSHVFGTNTASLLHVFIFFQ